MLVIVIIAIAVSNAGYVKIDPEEVYKPEYDGADGEASCYLVSDWGDVYDEIDETEDEDLEFDRYTFIEDIKASLSQEDDLSNGTEVTVTLSYSKKDAKRAKVKLTKDEFTFTVADLPVKEDVNPFDGLELVFDGVSPNGSASVNADKCHKFVKEYVNFSIENNGLLKNGENVTVNAEYSESMADEEMVRITAESQEFPVSGLSEYIQDVEGVDLSLLEDEIGDKITSAIAKARPSFGGLSFGGNYYLTSGNVSYNGLKATDRYIFYLKDGQRRSYGLGQNLLYTFYEMNLNDENGARKIYFAVRTYDIVSHEDGSVSWDSSIDINSADTLADLTNKYVNSNKEKYTVKEISDLSNVKTKGLGAD